MLRFGLIMIGLLMTACQSVDFNANCSTHIYMGDVLRGKPMQTGNFRLDCNTHPKR